MLSSGGRLRRSLATINYKMGDVRDPSQEAGRPLGRTSLVALACILIAFLAISLQRDGAAGFGPFHDDTLYWSVAQSIADGRGAALPNLPGEPALTKYPPLYPYVLAAVRTAVADPDQALEVAAGLSGVSAAVGLLLWFLYLRRWKGIEEWEAVAVIALAASSGIFLILSSALLSDTLFFALAAAALLAADSPSKRAWVLAALVGGLAVWTRTIGVALLGGIFISYWIAQRRREAVGFALLSAPMVASAVLAKVFAAAPGPGTESDAPAGYLQTWLYYADYAGFWRASVPDLDTLLAMLRMNVGEVVRAPAAILIGDPPPGPIGLVLWTTVTAAVFAGLYRQAKSDRLRACHVAVAFSLPIVWLWNFEIGNRLLLLFLPLFAAGLWVEGRHAVGGFLRSVAPGRPTGDRVVSAVCLLLLAAGAFWSLDRKVGAAFAPPSDGGFGPRYAQIAAWMRSETPPDARFVAIDDAYLYLATGRQGMWPLATTTDLRFLPTDESLEHQLDALPDVAREIDARYLVWTTNDYAYAAPFAERWTSWAQSFPEVARSADGTVRVYDRGAETVPAAPSSQGLGELTRR